jgi:hypothetical protein
MPIAVLLCNAQELAPKNELGFTLGGMPSLSRSTALGSTMARRFVSGNKVAI